MPCYQCQGEFTLFKREHSCKNCGFSFCSSCLKHEIKVPKIGDTARVCLSCFNALSRNPASNAQASARNSDDYLPDNYKRRVAALEKKNTRPSPYQRKTPNNPQDNVERRLENLQRDRFKNVPSVDEIEVRLTKLRGGAKIDTNASSLPPTRRKPEGEEINDLLKKEWSEYQLDVGVSNRSDDVPADVLLGKSNKEDETLENLMARAQHEINDEKARKDKEDDEMKQINSRLKNLRDNPGQNLAREGGSSGMPQTDLTEEEEINLLTKKLTEEARLEDSLGAAVTGKESPEASAEEDLPWCCICSEDATLRCIDCDEDLYCRRCFKECHTGADAKHRSAAYKPAPRKRP